MNRELPAHHVYSVLPFPPSPYNFPIKASTLSDTKDRIFGNFSQDGMWTWLVKGSNLEVFSANSAERCSSWCLGAVLKDTRTSITAVMEFRCIADPAPRLIVAADWGASNGLLCLYDVKMSKATKAIELPSKITSLDVISTQGGSGSDTHSLSKELCHMFGIVAVGTDDGHVYIVDLNLDEETYCNEVDPDTITFITQQTHNIMGKRENALCHNQHLCLPLNGDGHYRGYFQYRDQDNTPLESFNSDDAAVTALKFFRHVTLLAVGFNFGGIQLWNMSHLNLQYSCPLYDNLSPVIKFAFQEPENDPKNFCYFWAVRGCEDEHSDVLTVASLYSLCCSKKEWIDNYGFLYQGFQSCNLRFEYCLGIDCHASDDSSDVTSRLISCYTIQQADILAIGRPELDDTLHNEEWSNNPDYSICVLAWEAWRDGEESNSSCYLVLFDVNQWYRAQMPFKMRFSTTEFCSYLGVFSLSQAVDQLSTEPLLAVHLSTSSLAKFQSLSNAEEFYFPSSLSFDLCCLAEVGIIQASYFGCQRMILSEMTTRGPYCVVEPKTLYRFCEHTGLITTKCASNKSVTFMREQLLTVALENNMSHFVNSCIQLWCRGEFAHFGCSLKLIFDWAWRKVSQIKTSIDKLCVPLFNCSGQELDQSTLRLLHYYVSQLNILSNIFHLLHSQNVPIREQGEQELEQRREVTQLIAVYLKLILWLYVCNLLPEHIEGEAYGENEVAYPVSMLSKTYASKRQELQNLHSVIGQTDVLMIDGLISEMGSALSHQWEKSSWKGVYPPPSFYALLNTYLINTIPLVDKHQLMLYVLLDMAAFLSDRQSHLIEKLMKFPAVFPLSFSMMKIIHGFWLLDHSDFEEAISVLLDPMINAVDLLPWHHLRILKAFLYQGEHQKAMKYCRVRNPPHQTPEEVKLRLTIFLANGLTNEAFHFQRQFRDRGSAEDLLNHFFLGCQQTHTLDALLQLPLSPLEEDALISFLHSSPDQKSQELLVTYFLQRCHPIEAAHLNDKLKSQIMHHDEQRATSLNALVNGYMQILPDVQKRLLTDLGFQPPSKILTKREVIPRPQPLSTYVTTKKLKTISHSSLQWTVMDKVNEIQNETSTEPCTPLSKRLKDNNFWKTDAVPFIGTPLTPRYKSENNETKSVVFATPVTHNVSISIDNEYAVTPSKKSRLLDVSAFQSTEKERRRNLKHISGEVSSLLQTPPIRRKTPAGCTTVLDDRSNFGTTPQSILKIRLGGARASTPFVESAKTSQSYMRSVLEKIAQKEKDDSLQNEQGTDFEGQEDDSSMKQLRFKVPENIPSTSNVSAKWPTPTITSLSSLHRKTLLKESISTRMECSPRPALHDSASIVPSQNAENDMPEYSTEQYDPVSRIISPKFKAPKVTTNLLLSAHKNKESTEQTSAEQYDPVSHIISPKFKALEATTNLLLSAHKNKEGTEQTSAEQYDPVSRIISPKFKAPKATTNLLLSAHKNKESTEQTSAEQYDPVSHIISPKFKALEATTNLLLSAHKNKEGTEQTSAEQYDPVSRIISPKFKAPKANLLLSAHKNKEGTEQTSVTVKTETETIIKKKVETVITEENTVPSEHKTHTKIEEKQMDVTYPSKIEPDKASVIKSETKEEKEVALRLSDSESEYESYSKEEETEDKMESESPQLEEKPKQEDETKTNIKDFWEKKGDERLSVSPIKSSESPKHIDAPKESTPEKHSSRRSKKSATAFTELLQTPYETRSRSRSNSKSPSSSHTEQASPQSPMQPKAIPDKAPTSVPSSKIVTRTRIKAKPITASTTEITPLTTATTTMTTRSSRRSKMSLNESGESKALPRLTEPSTPTVPSFVFSPPLTRSRTRQKRNDESFMSTSSILIGDTSVRQLRSAAGESIEEMSISVDKETSLNTTDTSQLRKKTQGNKKKTKKSQKTSFLSPSSCVINLISPAIKSELPSQSAQKSQSHTSSNRHRMTLRKGPFRSRKFVKL